MRRKRAVRGRSAAPSWEQARRAAGRLTVLRGVLDDVPGRAWQALVAELAGGSPDPDRVAAAYARLFTALAEEAELGSFPLVGDAWQTHLLSRLLDDDSPFSRKAERAGAAGIGAALMAQARADLALLQRCHALAGRDIGRAAARAAGVHAVPWEGFRPLSEGAPPAGDRSRAPRADRSSPHRRSAGQADAASRARMLRRFHSARDWPALVRELAGYFAASGAGLFGRYRAFRWVRDGGHGRLEGVASPDPVRLDDLVGYDLERQPAVENTRQFVAGAPANSVLLYGDRGTGKSSTVKALFNEFAGRGLRLIEVAKEHLADFPAIVGLLRGRRERFILFVDDLSFDEHETQYKALKAVLEGGIEARPANVVLYATSNRRRLVVERFADRQGSVPDEEVHPEEAAQEKLSLADRFGIHAPFLLPDQGRYLEIVEGLAARAGLRVAPADLRQRALTWAQWHNGRSCRTARQFIDALVGEAMLSGSAARPRRGSPR